MSNYASKLIKCTFPSQGVLQVTLARPPVNAYNSELSAELQRHFERASGDPDVRCVVLRSDLDKGFTAGLDLFATNLLPEADDPARAALALRQHIIFLQQAVSSIQNCDKPVVAAVHGICFGAGVDLFSACDVRLCAEGTVFSIKEVDIGLAADIGSLQRLPRVTGNASLLYELALTARNFGPPEAEKLGLVSRVVGGGKKGVQEAAMELAKVIASKSPIATLSTKHLLNYSREHTVEEGLRYTQAWNMAMVQASDVPASFQAFTQKKPATYAPLPGPAKL
ncbi:hypothetical protein NBRC10512_007511 [Rhodotorula toruloides]|uniref:RHTO0S06e00144g1_1 n=2 Tax=Rhodotorula toruloides TaxID=5286 RepID=A0A061B0U0_RHOTO|nr:delta(3,5)-Delta(2,4)-dienoyl-CoA isomerase [Rhodotorula toruloides NP11]EMS23998.1 delta(3,5)-Delta(2,4)-dienoyl-CoA isomerase [Rhodotorula toruloides NP11]KAJ8293226.1 Delta(3,5)-Delta(2,4)-dienoyl-CoA isomerase, mitochondrial [Rhodotorula toruloides]CDR41268.1 RHTO0S06e00144g1_1 [Rhodotorula toruloides]